MKNVILLADSRTPAWNFAKKIKDYIQKTYSVDVPLNEVSIVPFRNGELDMEVPVNVRKKDIYFIHDSTKNPSQWLTELILIKDLLQSASAETVSFVLPDMLYSRKDWKDRPHVPISARAVAASISPGLKRIITMDLHSASIHGFYPACCPVDNLSSFLPVIDYLKEHEIYFGKAEDLVIVTPDAGGAKRAKSFSKKLSSKYPIAIIDKRKDPKTGQIIEMDFVGDVKDKDCLIFDDILDSGGTLCEASAVLKKNGARKVYCCTTHGLFTLGTEKICCCFDKVLTSNTHYRESFTPIDIIDVSPLFAEAIYRAQSGLSISSLYASR
jgi:ribose-phosphate pyrophosphokinase